MTRINRAIPASLQPALVTSRPTGPATAPDTHALSRTRANRCPRTSGTIARRRVGDRRLDQARDPSHNASRCGQRVCSITGVSERSRCSISLAALLPHIRRPVWSITSAPSWDDMSAPNAISSAIMRRVNGAGDAASRPPHTRTERQICAAGASRPRWRPAGNRRPEQSSRCARERSTAADSWRATRHRAGVRCYGSCVFGDARYAAGRRPLRADLSHGAPSVTTELGVRYRLASSTPVGVDEPTTSAAVTAIVARRTANDTSRSTRPRSSRLRDVATYRPADAGG